MRRPSRVLAILALSGLIAACTSAGASPSVAPSAAPSVAPSVAASAAPTTSPTPDACAKDSLAVVTPGTFTIGTDNPAYPPYFAENAGGPKTAPWELGDPTNGKGFESAVAYAIADALGFAKTEVTWVVVPFVNSFAPGPKTFDIDLNQVSYKPERAQTADLSDGYYFGNQSLVAPRAVRSRRSPRSPASRTSISVPKWERRAMTRSPRSSPRPRTRRCSTPTTPPSRPSRTAPSTASWSTCRPRTSSPTSSSRSRSSSGNSTAAPPEYFSAVLTKDSPLTACVNTAIGSLTADGTLDALASQWLPFQDAVPVFQP